MSGNVTAVDLAPLSEPSTVIGGAPVTGAGAPIDVTDPSTEAVLGTLPASSEQQVDAAVLAAREAFDDGRWSGLSGAERADAMTHACSRLAYHREEFVRLLVSEVGCPVSTVRSGHVELALQSFQWFAEAARVDRTRHLAPDLGATPSASLVRQLPVGVVAAICGYNSPLMLAVTKLGPALAVGCTAVVMPSALAPMTLLRLVEILQDDLPAGVVNSVLGGADVGRALTVHRGVDKVTFTGSVDVGRQVMRQAAEGPKGVVLELGGKSPAILLPGADLEEYLPALHRRWARNAGQGCQAPTRVLVPRPEFDGFVDATRRVLDGIVVGDPWDPRVETGPVITARHRDRIAGYIAEALAAGATVLAESPLPSFERGWWSAPMVLGGIEPTARICQEEIFGPVSVALPYDEVDEAVAIANAVDYGLGGYVYGPDLEECHAVAARIRAGSISINGGGNRRPDAPFGGFKASGLGREQGEEGMHEFLGSQHVQWPLPGR